jgi:RHS repeat-associated protein
MGNGSANAADVIALPQGGGAQRGIGESFAPDLQTGTGNFTVPLSLPAGRNGFGPSLNLSYSTGNGNGPFGLGWGLSVPGVARKTSRGVPRYRDTAENSAEWDTFILSGSEDLVPVVKDNGVSHFRPRTEGLFAHIERNRGQGGDWWEVRSKDGLISRYSAALADPGDSSRVFTWNLASTEDPFGNTIVYDYLTDRDPSPQPRWIQAYLRQVRYIDLDAGGFLVSVTFDYKPRPDAFTDHRAGFAIRTGLRCASITVRTHDGQDRIVRSYRFAYDQAPFNGVSLLRQVQLVGADDAATLPPLEFAYTGFDPVNRHDLFPVTGPDAPPASLASPDYDLVDLSGDGLPDIIQLNGVARTWRNRGNGLFDRPTTMRDAPAGVALADPGVQIMDANGDGRADLVLKREGIAGHWPLRFDGRWDDASFRKYRQAPTFSLDDPEVRLVDLDGDGVTDLIRAGDRLVCVFHDPETATWRDPVWLRLGALEGLPTVSFSDPRVKWADLSGDGLQDLAIVHQGSVRYWPNQGHGAWGAPVTMALPTRLPWGFNPARLLVGDVDGDGLADLVYVEDGSVTLWVNQSGGAWSQPVTIQGTPSITDADAVRIVDLLGSGIGGALFTANATSSGFPRANYHFLDLTGAAKPYLLNRMDNHLGAVTEVGYRSSTADYLRDAADPATRWRTPLPFPVQVVGTVEVIDAISKGKLTTEYRYRHGYWDGGEREFRGFGVVEQADTETFERYEEAGLHGEAEFAHAPEARFSPPTLTRTWFHLGPVGDEFGDWRELDYRDEFWSEDPPAFGQHESVTHLLTTHAQRRARRDALRALRGHILRTELYARDGSALQDRPYTVTESQYGLREESPPPDDACSRIFFPYLVAQRTTQWERGEDPQTLVTLSSSYDPYGQPTEQTSVALPRRQAYRRPVTGAVIGEMPGDEVNETRILATHTRTAYCASDAAASRLIADRVAHTRIVELKDPPPVNEQDPDDLSLVLHDGIDAAWNVHDTFMHAFDGWSYGDPLPDGIRLTGHTLHHYDGPAFDGLDPGELGAYAALTRTETLVFAVDPAEDAEDTLAHAYGDRRPAYLDGPATPPNGAPAGFGADLGYRRETASLLGYHDGYYIDSASRKLDVQDTGAAQHRGIMIGTRDPFGNVLTIEPDANWFMPAIITDPVGLTITATYDSIFLLPASVTDANGHVTTYIYTPLGLLASVMFARGAAAKPELAYRYDLHAWDAPPAGAAPGPVWVHTTQRVWHALDGVPTRVGGALDDVIESREYSDGFGRLLQKRTQADALRFGETGDDTGLLVAGAPAPGHVGGPASAQREYDAVVVSGWQVHDNKGRVIERYEPFFAASWAYQPEADAKKGRHADLHYDPRGQLLRTVNPDGSEQRLVIGTPLDPDTLDDLAAFEPSPWEIVTYDANDLAPLTGAPARAPASHHFTPSTTVADALGRVICQVSRNGEDPAQDWFVTRSVYDGRGNLLEVRDPLYRPPATPGGAPHRRPAFTHAYDLQNRLLAVDSIDAGRRTSVLDATGNVVELRDDKGTVTLRQYDRLNRVSAVWARDGGTGNVTLRERLAYGDGGDPAQPAAERAAAKSRNQLGRLVRHHDEAGLLECLTYDFKGNVLDRRRRVVSDAAIRAGWIADWAAANAEDDLDATGYETTSTFDALNRPVAITYPAQTDGHRPVLTPAYNRAGALERVALDGDTYVERIAYNAKGQRVLVVHGNRVMTRYAYDPDTFRLARLRSERTPTLAPATDTWTSQGQPLQDLTFGYDLAGNIISIQERTPGCGVTGSNEGRDRLTRAFEYDPLYRLIKGTGRACADIAVPRPVADLARRGAFPAPHRSGAAAPNQDNAPDLTETYTESFSYDPAGNLHTLAYDAGPGRGWTRAFGLAGEAPAGWRDASSNRLTSLADGANAFAYRYDANGNLERENTDRRYAWDHADRLVGFTVQPAGATKPSVEARYLYGADGQRVKKWVRTNGTGDGDSCTYIDGLFEHVRWKKPNEPAKERNLLHLIDGARRIALIHAGDSDEDDAGPPVQYQLADHLGSSSLVVDESGGWINREEYFPYGETSFGGYARKRYRFTGKERDAESGLAYHGARYYAPALARWTSCDPIALPPRIGTRVRTNTSRIPRNLFGYAGNSPVVLHDPTGRAEVKGSVGVKRSLGPVTVNGTVDTASKVGVKVEATAGSTKVTGSIDTSGKADVGIDHTAGSVKLGGTADSTGKVSVKGGTGDTSVDVSRDPASAGPGLSVKAKVGPVGVKLAVSGTGNPSAEVTLGGKGLEVGLQGEFKVLENSDPYSLGTVTAKAFAKAGTGVEAKAEVGLSENSLQPGMGANQPLRENRARLHEAAGLEETTYKMIVQERAAERAAAEDVDTEEVEIEEVDPTEAPLSQWERLKELYYQAWTNLGKATTKDSRGRLVNPATGVAYADE